MWTRKDTVSMALAAVATFGATVAMFLPRVVNATAEQSNDVVLSPVLTIGGCEVRAQVAGTPMLYGSGPNSGQQIPGSVTVAAGAVPAFKFIVSNPTDKEATVTFTAMLASSAVRD